MRKLLGIAVIVVLAMETGALGQEEASKTPNPVVTDPHEAVPLAKQPWKKDPFAKGCAGMEAERKEDRFTGFVSAVASMPPVMRQFQPMVIWSSERPDSLVFEIIGSDERWHYLDCYTLNLLADGKRVPIENVRHHGQVERGYVIEFVDGTIPWKEAQLLADFDLAEYRICSDESRFTQKFACQVRSVMRIASEWKAAHDSAAHSGKN